MSPLMLRFYDAKGKWGGKGMKGGGKGKDKGVEADAAAAAAAAVAAPGPEVSVAAEGEAQPEAVAEGHLVTEVGRDPQPDRLSTKNPRKQTFWRWHTLTFGGWSWR